MFSALLVDDERNVLDTLLTDVDWNELGFDVPQTAANGQDALDRMTQNAVDLLVTDIRMPEMDGAEATRRIREFCPAIPIIAVTANAFDEDRRRAFEAGVDDFLTKPLSKAKLFETINRY